MRPGYRLLPSEPRARSSQPNWATTCGDSPGMRRTRPSPWSRTHWPSGWPPRGLPLTYAYDALLASNLVVRAAEHCAVAEHRDRTILAHGDHGSEGVVVAVAAARCVAGTAECLRRTARHRCSGSAARRVGAASLRRRRRPRRRPVKGRGGAGPGERVGGSAAAEAWAAVLDCGPGGRHRVGR